MPAIVRFRRSVLFMPGSNPRALERAKTLPADALIFDLEDAVAPDAKDMARQTVCDAVRAGGYGKRELIVRVNALTAAWGDADLAAVATCGAHAVLLPKVESAAMVRQVLTLLKAHGAPEHMAVWCMLETPRGILRAEDIAASPRVAALVMGTSDLTKELHARHTRERLPLLPSLGWCLLVGRAYGLTVLDGVHLDLGDDAGFEYACRQAADMGFDGKTLIHPTQNHRHRQPNFCPFTRRPRLGPQDHRRPRRGHGPGQGSGRGRWPPDRKIACGRGTPHSRTS